MRITLPDNLQDPFQEMGQHYASEIVGAAGLFSKTAYAKTTLSLRVFEAARVRTAEINGCMTCRAFRAKRDLPELASHYVGAPLPLLGAGDAPDEEFYQHIANWRDWPGYSDRERIAIELAERFCLEPQSLAKDDRFWEGAKAVLSDEEIVQILHCVGSFIATGRVAHVLGLDLICSVPAIGEAV